MNLVTSSSVHVNDSYIYIMILKKKIHILKKIKNIYNSYIASYYLNKVHNDE